MSEKREVQNNGEKTVFFTFARIVAWVLSHTVFPIKVFGIEKLDALDAPYILIGNHDTWYDPIVLACIVRRYEVRFISKKELMKGKFTSYLFGKLLHAISVSRHESDMAAMRIFVKTLKEGHVLGVFPEGTRHKNGLMEDMEAGVAMLALRSKVPIVPVYLTPKIRAFRRTNVVIGNQMDVTDLAEKGIDKETCAQLLKRITETYAILQKEWARK